MKECLERQVQPFECQLGRLRIELADYAILGAQRGEVFFLRAARDRMALSVPSGTALFQGGVV